MTDIDRVKQMVESGRITADEGEQLIRVLEDARAADEELQRADEEMGEEVRNVEASLQIERGDAPLPPVERALEPPKPEAPTTPHTPPAPAAPVAPPTPEAARAAAPAPEGTRWVRIEALAGDLHVKTDDSLDSPTVKSDGPVTATVEPSGDGYRVSWDQPTGSFLDKMLGRLKTGNLHLRIPKGYGLELEATAGNVELHGVPYLRGHLTAGNVEARGLKGIDFTGRAGNFELELELTSGAHQLKVTAGNLELELAPTSDVRVRAEASIGDVSSRVPGLETGSRGLGQTLEGVYGNGAADLELRVTTGNIELELADERR